MKGILFNQDMVRAILDGRKMVTRRVVKPQPRAIYHDGKVYDDDGMYVVAENQNGGVEQIEPPYRPGDILYVRETWAAWSPTYGTAPEIIYKADGYSQSHKMKWCPSIHMPREAARIFLRVTNVRVERLQNMPPYDIAFEGFRRQRDFITLWNSTLKPANRAIYGWVANPWVWVIEFERCEKPGGEAV